MKGVNCYAQIDLGEDRGNPQKTYLARKMGPFYHCAFLRCDIYYDLSPCHARSHFVRNSRLRSG